jgi:aryl carrier-like protein
VDRKLRTPVTFTEYAVARVAKKVIQNQSLSIEDDLWDYGLDSLAALQMESLLSSDFPQVSLDLIAQKKTIEKISRAIDETAERDNAPQVVFNEGSSTGVVHAFPGLGLLSLYSSILVLCCTIGGNFSSGPSLCFGGFHLVISPSFFASKKSILFPRTMCARC